MDASKCSKHYIENKSVQENANHYFRETFRYIAVHR